MCNVQDRSYVQGRSYVHATPCSSTTTEQTIFEVTMRSGSGAVQVMQQKRSYHGNVIAKKQQKKAAVEEEDQSAERGVADGQSQEHSTESDLKVRSTIGTHVCSGIHVPMNCPHI